MKKIITIITLAVVSLVAAPMSASAQTAPGMSSEIRKYLPKKFRKTSLSKLSSSQLIAAYNKALAKNPGAAASLYSFILGISKINSNPQFTQQLAESAIRANPSAAVTIFNTASSRLNSSQVQTLAKSVVAIAPQTKTAIAEAASKNTGGQVRSTDV